MVHVLRLAVLAAAMALTVPAAAQEATARIVVTGEGRATAPPDMAEFDVGVVATDAEAPNAVRQVSDRVAALLDRLAGGGVEAGDVQTSGLSLFPRFAETREPGGQPEIVGFTAENRVSVRVRDLERLGTLLQDLVGDGANTLGQIRFMLAEEDTLLAEARRRAVRDAADRAATLADAADVQLGAILLIEEGGNGPQPMMRTMAVESAVPIATGEVERRVQVTVTYEIAR